MPRDWYKRPFDLTVLVSAHLLLAPLWLLLWTAIPILIWLEDRGPVFYRQDRVGRGGRTFAIRKFRTMVPQADRIGPAYNVPGDRRVTRVGRFLRKTALDELPQLLNIWSGEMSFVGPKPLFVREYEEIVREIPGFERRAQARPGLTGLAQVYDKADDAQAKLRYDLEYIQRMSLWLDIRIMLLSVRNTVLGKWDERSGKPQKPSAGGADTTAHPH